MLDVDGVLTEGGVVYGTGGLEVKRFHVRDGSGLKAWRRAGRRSAFITGRSSPVVDVRAVELGVDFVFQGASDKLPAYRRLLEDAALPPSAVVLCRRRPARPAADARLRAGGGRRRRLPRGARRRPLRHPRPGGGGAVREVIELILRCQGEWDRIVARLAVTRSGSAIHRALPSGRG